jgi:hypothetical protein
MDVEFARRLLCAFAPLRDAMFEMNLTQRREDAKTGICHFKSGNLKSEFGLLRVSAPRRLITADGYFSLDRIAASDFS